MTFVTLESFDEVAKAIADCAFVVSELPVFADPHASLRAAAQKSAHLRAVECPLLACCFIAYVKHSLILASHAGDSVA